jgi:hypothetical protein
MRRGILWAAAAVVAALALLGGCGGGGDDDAGYSADTRASFLEPCVSGLGDDGQAICECSYDRIVEDVPFDTFQSIDRELQDNPDAELPDDVLDIVAACAADPTGGAEEATTTTRLP